MAETSAPGDLANEEIGEASEEYSELLLFSVDLCYMYKIPPRISSASHRADDWNVNKWAWEGRLRVVSQGVRCRILLEDKSSGQLFAESSVKENEPVPIEPVIDSSRYFVLKIDDPTTGRHAFVGIGFRERTEAYDFQASVYDHIQFLKKKREAEIKEKEYLSKPPTDYRLKDGIKIHLDLKKSVKPNGGESKLKKKLESLGLKGKGAPGDFLLVPPPPRQNPNVEAKRKEEDDFGDFVGG